MGIRIGIDVGGTFTDGIAIDDTSYEIIGKVKVPTTHSAAEGVAKGIIQAIKKLVEEYNLNPDDIVFLAHGTTQATNALLEGDVEKVSIVATGSGLEGMRAKSDTEIEAIELAPGKYIESSSYFINHKDLDRQLGDLIDDLKKQGTKVIVAAEPYSVDDPANENKIIQEAVKRGLSATATHEISKLYGLKRRTRTSVINGSILPKMIETANMTYNSVQESGIKAPLMIMRGDGGVMGIEEMKRRPILTLLSGPAGGVAGALMYEQVSDGIFLESGGTSTDISVIKNGEVMLDYAKIGNHKTFVSSLDVRTVGIAGGSMIVVEGLEIVDVGPRSAHIAGLPYEVFASEEDIVEPELIKVKPREGDPDYLAIKCRNGKEYALTLAGASNILKKVPEGSYAVGNYKAAYKAYEPLAKSLGKSVDEVAELVLRKAVDKVKEVVDELITDYELDKNIIELVGGGGSAGVVVPYLAEYMNLKYRIAKNAEVISTIGVALAMVKEVVERTIINPTEEDIMKVRNEAKELILKSGANENTVEIKVEIDQKNNLVRATATGSTDFKKNDLSKKDLKEDELRELMALSMETKEDRVKKLAESSGLLVYGSIKKKKSFFGLIKKKVRPLRIVTRQGVIKLNVSDGEVVSTVIANLDKTLRNELEKRTIYMDAGGEVPKVFIGCGSRILDFSGLIDTEQIVAMANIELNAYDEDEAVFIIFIKRG